MDINVRVTAFLHWIHENTASFDNGDTGVIGMDVDGNSVLDGADFGQDGAVDCVDDSGRFTDETGDAENPSAVDDTAIEYTTRWFSGMSCFARILRCLTVNFMSFWG